MAACSHGSAAINHPDFTALSQELNQWQERDDIDIVETDYGRAVRAETRQATAAAEAAWANKVTRPGRSAKPTPSKAVDIELD